MTQRFFVTIKIWGCWKKSVFEKILRGFRHKGRQSARGFASSGWLHDQRVVPFLKDSRFIVTPACPEGSFILHKRERERERERERQHEEDGDGIAIQIQGGNLLLSEGGSLVRTAE